MRGPELSGTWKQIRAADRARITLCGSRIQDARDEFEALPGSPEAYATAFEEAARSKAERCQVGAKRFRNRAEKIEAKEDPDLEFARLQRTLAATLEELGEAYRAATVPAAFGAIAAGWRNRLLELLDSNLAGVWIRASRECLPPGEPAPRLHDRPMVGIAYNLAPDQLVSRANRLPARVEADQDCRRWDQELRRLAHRDPPEDPETFRRSLLSRTIGCLADSVTTERALADLTDDDIELLEQIFGLYKLRGTEKQVRWARTIRARWVLRAHGVSKDVEAFRTERSAREIIDEENGRARGG